MRQRDRFFPFAFALLLAGCLGESPTGESWRALESQCVQSGGAWRTVADCPTSCWPLEPTADNCASIDEMVCIAMCAEQPACSCPVGKPLWAVGEGCVGVESCSDTGVQ